MNDEGDYEKINWDSIRSLPGMDELKINSQKGAAIGNDTVYGKGRIRDDYLDRKKLNTLIIHSRQDAATAVLNTILIYKYMESRLKGARNCRIFIILLLLYIAYKVS